MKRSVINKIIQESDEFIKSYGFRLPPFAYFQPDELIANKFEYQAIFDARLGWDITDYGEVVLMIKDYSYLLFEMAQCLTSKMAKVCAMLKK